MLWTFSGMAICASVVLPGSSIGFVRAALKLPIRGSAITTTASASNEAENFMPALLLRYMHNKLHLRMDRALNFSRTFLCERNRGRCTRSLALQIKSHAGRDGIDVVRDFVVVPEDNLIDNLDGDFGLAKGAIGLHNLVVGRQQGKCQHEY